eukprot:TRINITY_DN1265_c0_g1_i1.p1 TRINITY_DN1265_c0_g1~~TRINITY_DN1265_c0_g1_i1.p1  ORF type:complete len:669 (+),score=126.54 TRINITY_DN1265_c0_g1_i1:415-2421(+)
MNYWDLSRIVLREMLIVDQFHTLICSTNEATITSFEEGNMIFPVGIIPPELEVITQHDYISLMRNIHTPDLYFRLKNNNFPKQNEHDFNISITGNIPGVTSCDAPYHEDTHIECDGDSITIQYSSIDELPLLGNDFIIRIALEDPHLSYAILEKNEELGTVASIVSMSNNNDSSWKNTEVYDQLRVKNISEYIFLVDCSGSMYGERLDILKKTLKIAVHSLPEGCLFNIVRFGTTYEALFNKSEPLRNKNSFELACMYLEKMKANLGGTNIYDPLKFVYITQNNDVPTNVFLFLDGDIQNRSRIKNLVMQNNHMVKVFTIGLGDEVNKDFITKISIYGNGTMTCIKDSTLDDLPFNFIEILKSSMGPHISNTKIKWTPYSVLQAPGIISKIGLYQRCFVLGISSPEKNEIDKNVPESFTIKGQGIDSRKKKTIAPVEVVEGSIIHKLAAYHRIKSLLNGTNEYIELDNSHLGKNVSFLIDSELRSLSTNHQVLFPNNLNNVDEYNCPDMALCDRANYKYRYDPNDVLSNLISTQKNDGSWIMDDIAGSTIYSLDQLEDTPEGVEDATVEHFPLPNEVPVFPTIGDSSEIPSPIEFAYEPYLETPEQRYINYSTAIGLYILKQESVNLGCENLVGLIVAKAEKRIRDNSNRKSLKWWMRKAKKFCEGCI